MFKLDKFSLIILTRCNLRCKLCCEYVPQNKPFPDMTILEEKRILYAFFRVVDQVRTLHLTGGGEPFLHRELAELVETAMEFSSQFERLMLFTNCTVKLCDSLAAVLKKYHEKIIVQVSRYGIRPEIEKEVLRQLESTGVTLKVEKYYGEDQSFGGWIDFGAWESHSRSDETLQNIFQNCAVTKVMHGNWRTRDGKVHWCSRSQRGMDLGLLPDIPTDYVDLFDESESVVQKREKFQRIAQCSYLFACNFCSGEQGTEDVGLRHPAAEQMEVTL